MISPFYQEPDHIVYQGHALDILKALPSESVDCVMTSPPYWGLRTYKTEPQIWGDNHCEHEWGELLPRAGYRSNDSHPGTLQSVATQDRNTKDSQFCLKCNAWRGELGLEPTIELYISHLVQIFNEVKRVLKKTGTCWVNIDDSYAGSGSPGGDFRDGKGGDDYLRPYNRKGLPAKSLCLIPSRFALAMVENGWILRNDIVWNKPNPMPESVKDRFTTSWEHLFFFTRNNQAVYWINTKTHKITDKQPLGVKGDEGEDWEWIKHSACQGKGCNNKRCINGKIKSSLWEGHDYWFEQQFEAFDRTAETIKRAAYGRYDLSENAKAQGREGKPDFLHIRGYDHGESQLGRNRRDVWEITTQPYPEAHFATFPEKLCEIPILAGCPAHICPKCGKAREKIYETEISLESGSGKSGRVPIGKWEGQPQELSGEYDIRMGPVPTHTDKGYTDCGCNAGFEPGIVLDPFCGSGKALVVTKRLGRKAIGIELNPDYCKLTVRELQGIPLAMALS